MTIRSLVLAMGAILAYTIPPALGADRLVTTAGVNLRSGASVDHGRITTLPAGTAVRVDHCQQRWCLVETQGVSGWMSARYLARPGVIERYDPPVVPMPPAARVEPLVPRNYHDLGLSHHHRPTRDFHRTRR